MNELSTLAKFLYHELTTQTGWSALAATGTMFLEENIPVGVDVSIPQAMFTNVDSMDERGAFGYRLYTSGIYQIKGVVEGSQFKLLSPIANLIDTAFDWQNQMDVSAGRPRCQEIFTDPDDSSKTLMIMCLLRNKPIKYPTFSDGVNYCHLGGEYLIEYYSM